MVFLQWANTAAADVTNVVQYTYKNTVDHTLSFWQKVISEVILCLNRLQFWLPNTSDNTLWTEVNLTLCCDVSLNENKLKEQ